MIRRFFAGLASVVTQFLQNPLKVLTVSLVLVVAGLLLDGSLFRLWRLNRDTADLERRIETLKVNTNQLDMKIAKAKDPNFIEMQAREKFDLASEGDLIFVFSDEE